MDKKKKEHELQLWHEWKQAPTHEKPKKLEPLLTSLEPLINRHVNKFKTAPVPPAAIKGIAQVAVVKALNNYSPDKGTALGTFVDFHLRKIQSFVVKHQNVGRIPEQRARQIGRYQEVKSQFESDFGYSPTPVELSNELNKAGGKTHWTPAEVMRMERELRKNLISSRSLEPDLLPQTEDPYERDVLQFIEDDLDDQEKAVFHRTVGMGGFPQMQAGDIAKELGLSGPKVSRIRANIARKLKARGI